MTIEQLELHIFAFTTMLEGLQKKLSDEAAKVEVLQREVAELRRIARQKVDM